MIKWSTIWTLCILSFLGDLKAQNEYHLVVNPSEFKEELSSLSSPRDSITIINHLQKIVGDWRKQNYLLSNVDSIIWRDSTCHAYLHKGDQYAISKIKMDEPSTLIVDAAGLSSLNLKTKEIDSTLVQKYLSDILQYLVNNGYPFAQVGFINATTNNGEVQAELKIDKQDYIAYDTINYTKDRVISKSFLTRYLDIRKGQPYDQSQILKVKKKIKDLGFVKLEEDPYVSFIDRKAILRLPLVAQKSNSFDFVIGVLPSTENGVRVWKINGELKADFVNRLGYGERISIEGRQLRVDDRLLSLKASYPYIRGLPLGLDGFFQLRINRNISVDLNTNIGGQYITNGTNYIKAFGSIKSSRIINYDTTAIINNRRLPDNLDFRFRGGGLEYFVQQYDYRFNPRRGWSINTQLNLGLRTIIKNLGLQNLTTEDLSFQNVYDTLDLTSFQANLTLIADYFIPVQTYGAIRIGFNGGLRYNEGRFIENELYRIGGNKLLRGFDELSILADYYGVLSTEFRLIIDQNSYFSFPFVDISRMQTYIEGVPRWDNAYGVGLGLNFATRAGIFNISFAAGSRLNNPIEFNNTKVHFGYINLF